ncbi:Ribosomal protein L7Ae/L30e/S12e/Gadd45 [Trinorchestia longiramus]|nr:Ribosomal protein L7Ae/L30e/S12e/Gadd45 [Trinorchestia longiramus]
MLSADVPEFIPKAQQSKPLTVSDLAECDIKEEQLPSVASQFAPAPLAHLEGGATDSQVPNAESKAKDAETSTAADKAGGAYSASTSVHEVDSASISQNDALEDSSLVAYDLSQTTNGVNHVIENKYPNSKLSATVAEFIPANPVFLDCAPNEPTNSHLPYTSAASNTPYIYPGSPYGYYTPWATEIDYSTGYYGPMLNTGAYSGDFYVPDGGYVYDGTDSYAQHSTGMVVDPMYYDSSVMGGMDYGGGGGVAFGAYGSNFTGRGGGGRGRSNYNRRPYNSNYKRGGRRTDSGRGGGRGGGGGGRQPSTEIGICSQTGEMTLSKRKAQQDDTHNKSDANGWASQAHVQASNIIKNANNWPSLAQGKPDNSSGAVTPVEPASNQDSHLPLTNGTSLPAMPTNSFSSIAKKKSTVAEVPAPKASKETKGVSTASQKNGRVASTQPSNDIKNNSDLGSQVPKPALLEQPSMTSLNGVASDMNGVNSVSSEQKSESLGSKISEDVKDHPKLSKNSRKKARRKQKKLKELEEKASQDNTEPAATPAVTVNHQGNSTSAQLNSTPAQLNSTPAQPNSTPAQPNSTPAQLNSTPAQPNSTPAQPNSTPAQLNSTPAQLNFSPAVPSMASILFNDQKKEKVPTSSVPVSNLSSLRTPQKKELSSTKPSKEKVVPFVNNVAHIKSMERTVPKSNSEKVVEKEAAPKEKGEEEEGEEEEWITVVKKSKGKKGAMNKEGERAGSLGFRQAYNNNGSASNFRGPPQAKTKKFERKQVDRPERTSANHGNFLEKQTSEKNGLVNGRNSTEASGTVVAEVPSVDDSVTTAPVAEHKPKDQNDPEYKELMRKRTMKKENAKQEKKIIRETSALQKQANARKDSKISVLQTDAQKTSPAPKNFPKNETFRIKSEEYPTLGSNKKTKPLLNSIVKGEVTKMNGIVQDSANAVSDEAPAWVRSVASSSTVQPAISGECAAPSLNASGSICKKETTERPAPAANKSSPAVVPTAVDRSVRKKTTTSLPPPAADNSKKAKSARNSNMSAAAAAPRPKVKTTDKLTIDLNFVIKKKLGQRREKAARALTSGRSQDPVRRAATGGVTPRPSRLAVHAPNTLREKGKKKNVTPIQRYKKLRAQDKENFLRLVEAQRRQNERSAVAGDADFRSAASDAAGADGWTDVGEETPNSPKKISSPPQEASAAPDLVIAKLREELPHLLMKKQASAAASFRYNKNMVTDELREHLEGMLSKLVEFQKRKFAMEQIKAKSKRRYVCGIREATKKVEKLKLLIVATDVAKSIPLVTEGLSKLIVKADEHKVPVVFGMSRLKLAQICKTLKNKKVSCVGIMNYQGTENHVNAILALLPELRKQWQRTVLASNTYYENSVVPCMSLSPSTITQSVASTSSVSASSSATTSTPAAVTSSSSVEARSSSVGRPDEVAVSNSSFSKGKNGMTSSSNSTFQVSQKIVGILKDKRESS